MNSPRHDGIDAVPDTPFKNKQSIPKAYIMDIKIRGIQKSFGGFAALGGVDLDIASGELIALLGPSGRSTPSSRLAGRPRRRNDRAQRRRDRTREVSVSVNTMDIRVVRCERKGVG